MERTQLYLDTARLGKMSPGAAQAHADFGRLAAEEAGSLFFGRFLRWGAETWTPSARSRYPGLANWRGIGALKASLRQLTGANPEPPRLLANRSAQLMKLASRLFFGSCRNVLVTDLGWQPCHDLLAAAGQRASRRITTVPLRDGILQKAWNENAIVQVVLDYFLRERCDGAFLSAVSHLGVRLSVERIVRALEAAGEVRFVVIDGAQEFCHVPAEVKTEYCDLYLAGCHKWLGAYHPLGVGFYGRRRSLGMIETILANLLTAHEIDDPLLRFAVQVETNNIDGYTETVSLLSLFSGHGAIADAMRKQTLGLPARLANAQTIAALALEKGWEPLLTDNALRTGILLLQNARTSTSHLPAAELRERFAGDGIALTAYNGGTIRLAFPDAPLNPDDITLVENALAR